MENYSIQEMSAEYNNWYDKLTDEQKAEVDAHIDDMITYANNGMRATNLLFHGCLDYHEPNKWGESSGWYVYLWKHIDGSPFYVGSGKGDRWLNFKEHSRTNAFIKEIKKRDAIVYKLIDELDEQDARDAESCCIHYLSANGYNLAQTQWNYSLVKKDDRKAERVNTYGEKMKNPICIKAVSVLLEKLKSEENDYDLKEIHQICADREADWPF